MRKILLALSALACALQAGAAFADGSARGQFPVWAIGLPNGYLVMDRQSRVIQVTTDHRLRDAADAPGDSRVLVTNQVPPARSADLHVSGALIRKAGIEGIAAAMEIGASGPMAAGRGGGGQVSY